jgi:outer membrane protein OmpA-like peptidoglycan-associated protein
MESMASLETAMPNRLGTAGPLCALLVLLTLPVLLAAGAAAEPGPDAEAINARLYEALRPPRGSGRIETVAGQMYLSKENIDAATVSEALAAMLEQEQTTGESVAVRTGPRINFEIHFPKNTAELTEEARRSLDVLADALDADAYQGMRFVLGGHTDQDGDDAVNQPLSQARAERARDYLVEEHRIDASRLVARGFGAGDPLRAVEETAQDKLYNRRVDLRPLH